ncbi:MAG TPA: UPF0182 family protein [Streptosporangiaceae bacterium]|nr:UPF0182 family protein [Streptosporangiaceae bacterium]
MTFRVPGANGNVPGRGTARRRRWPRRAAIVAAAILAFVIVMAVGSGIWTEFLWFSSVHYTSVFATSYGVKWALFGITGVLMAGAAGFNAALAYRLRPENTTSTPEQRALDGYRVALEPRRWLVLGICSGLIGLISGLTAAASWRTWLMFVNRTSFHIRDPQFHLDLSFFVFVYPFIQMVLTYLFAAVLLSTAIAAGVHYLYGGLRVQSSSGRATAAAQAHLFTLLGLFVLVKAVSYWIDRYGIDLAQGGTVATGASYTDVNAVLPAKTVLAAIAVVCAVLFFAGAIRKRALLPAVGFGLLVLSAILIGGVYPAIVQQFVVKPNALAKEAPYLQREIGSTRAAYAVDGAVTMPYQAASVAASSSLAAQAAALPSVRLIDPGVVSQTFQQLQQVKSFYSFPGQLDVDRYQIPGAGSQPQDMVVGVRGLGGPPPGQATWVNTHLVYTHGFGFAAASANAVQGDGDPDFTESDIPPHGVLGSYQPRIYFGQQQTQYAIAGAPRGRAPMEFDYPNESTAGQVDNTYTGGGGVPIGSFLNRLLYAVKFHEPNILLSSAINADSRILYVRDPLSRVAKIAPFLTLDGDAYPVVADHSIYWIVDGYTTTDDYPYSQRLDLQQATADSTSPGGSAVGQPGDGELNYIRNSVKAVVNAYTGAVTLYQWDRSDPVLDTWMKAFSGIIKPRRDIPPALLAHMRYPSDLLDVQRQILASYHVTQAQAFYGGQNFWTLPDDPSGPNPNVAPQPAYYLTMTMPGYPAPEFSLSTSFVQRGRPNMAAFMTVDSNPRSPDYGRIRILDLPQDTAIPGPEQVQNSFETNPTASIQLSQLRKGGSKVILGNLITLPFGGAFLYIEPVYVEASAAGSTGSYPTEQRVFVSFGGNVGYGQTLAGALGQLFGTPGSSGGTPPAHSTGSSAALKYVKQAQQYYQQGQQALRTGDFAAYGQDMAKMKNALDQAERAAASQ